MGMTKTPNLQPNPYKVAFFYDFMLFLNRLVEKPIKRTVTGAISLTDIKELLEKFKQQDRIQEYKKYGWHLRREEELQFLVQMKIIAEVMYLTHKRKGYLYLSKSGKRLLKNIDTLTQYQNIVLNYWHRVNWEYFTSGKEVRDETLAKVLQNNQGSIWKALYTKGTEWIDYEKFCFSLLSYFRLDSFLDNFHDKRHDLLFHIDLILFRRNLERLGCVEVEKKRGKYDFDKEIVRFHPTSLGLTAFHKALYEDFTDFV